MRKHRVALEHHAAVGAGLGGELFAIDQDLPARGPLLAEQQAQEGGLAATGRPDQRHERARRDLEADAFQHDLVAVFLPDVLDPDRGHAGRTGTNQGNSF